MIKKINIVIAVKKKTPHLDKVLSAISKQTLMPSEVIICTYKNFNLKKKPFKLKVINSTIQNQVYQRLLAIKNLKNKNNILLQLDERTVLDANAIMNLQKKWSTLPNNYYGIGLNIDQDLDRGFFDKIKNLLNIKGKVYNVGINTGYQDIKKDIEVEWLSGGSSSWRFDKKFHLKKNKFSNNEWFVGEDIMQSLKIKKNQKLLVCCNAKAKMLQRSKKELKEINFFERGKSNINWKKKLSKSLNCNIFIFYIFNLPLILISLIINIFFFKMNKFKFSLGQLKNLI